MIQGNTNHAPGRIPSPAREITSIDTRVHFRPVALSSLCHMTAVKGVINDSRWPLELPTCPDDVPRVSQKLRYVLWVFGGQHTSIDGKALHPRCEIGNQLPLATHGIR